MQPPAPRRRTSLTVGMSSSSQPRHAVVTDDPGRADRGDALARRVLPRLRHEPGQSAGESLSSASFGCGEKSCNVAVASCLLGAHISDNLSKLSSSVAVRADANPENQFIFA